MYEVSLSFTAGLITGLVLFINEPMMALGATDQSRETAIRSIVQYLHDTIAVLQGENNICNYECDCIMLGALTKHMRRLKITPLKLNPNYRGLCFVDLKSDLRDMKYPGPYAISLHSCVLSLPSKINYILNSAGETLQGLDIESFTKPGEPGESE